MFPRGVVQLSRLSSLERLNQPQAHALTNILFGMVSMNAQHAIKAPDIH